MFLFFLANQIIEFPNQMIAIEWLKLLPKSKSFKEIEVRFFCFLNKIEVWF